MPDRNDQPLPPGPRQAPAPDAVRLQRARVVERLAASTWHELAQPVHALASLAALLRVEPSAADELGADPDLLADAVGKVRRLARTFTALAGGRGHPGGLRELVEEVTALAGNDLVDVAVTNDIPREARQPAGDEGALLLVAASLLVDAVDALGGPGAARGRLRWALEPAADEAATGERVVAVVVEHDGGAGPGEDMAVLQAIVAAAGGRLRLVPTSGGRRAILELPAERVDGSPPPDQRG